MHTQVAYQGRVLLVDDEHQLMEIYQEFLASQGYEVVAFISAELALETFRRDVNYFDILLTDYQMPGMNGAEFCAQIMLLRQNLPMLVVSGNIDDARRKRLLKIGVACILEKPIRLSLLAQEMVLALTETKRG